MKTFNFKTIAFMSVAALAVAAVVVGLSYSKSGTEKSAPAGAPSAKPALTVSTTQPQTSTLPIALTANGNITAWQEASIGAESSGLRLAQVLVNVGDTVQGGQPLARFADDSLQADVAQARAAVTEASANAAEATANADRARALMNTGSFSDQQIDQYLAAEQTAKARVASAQAALAAQELRLRYTQVNAPDSGIISARSATVGAVVANGTELFKLIRQGRLEWRAEVAASDLGRLALGSSVLVTPAGGSAIKGRVRMVAPTVDPQTRTALVYVDLPAMQAQAANAHEKRVGALPGMFARGEFELGQSPALTVPQQAVVIRDGFSYAFALNADQRVSQIKLQTGRRVGDRVEVLDGIKADAVLVASGAGFLNDGDLVKVVASAQAAAK